MCTKASRFVQKHYHHWKIIYYDDHKNNHRDILYPHHYHDHHIGASDGAAERGELKRLPILRLLGSFNHLK